MKASEARTRRDAAKFRGVLDALKLAAPVATAARFGSLAHCGPTSLAAASLLSEYNVTATLVPVCLVAAHEGIGQAIMVGASDEESTITASSVDSDPAVASEDRHHVVLEVSYHSNRALLDLTFGQLRSLGVSGAPLAISIPDADFEATLIATGSTGDDWNFRYHAIGPARASALRAKWPASPMTMFVDDLRDAVSLALTCKADHERFYSAVIASLRRSDPATLARVMATIGA